MPPIPGPDPPTRTRGNAIPRTALDMDRMAEVTDRDIAKARASWKTRAPDSYKGLIDARPDPEEK
jgi:hypothetical protein